MKRLLILALLFVPCALAQNAPPFRIHIQTDNAAATGRAPNVNVIKDGLVMNIFRAYEREVKFPNSRFKRYQIPNALNKTFKKQTIDSIRTQIQALFTDDPTTADYLLAFTLLPKDDVAWTVSTPSAILNTGRSVWPNSGVAYVWDDALNVIFTHFDKKKKK